MIVSNYAHSRDMRDRDVSQLHLLADKVLCQVKLPIAIVALRVAREGVGALDCCQKARSSRLIPAQASQELRQADGVLLGMQETEVLRFDSEAVMRRCAWTTI